MNTKINLTYKGVDYVLEYDRAIVKLLEANGFEITSALEKPMTNIELMFTASFQKNHRKTSQETINEIYKTSYFSMGKFILKLKLIDVLTNSIN